MADFFKEFEAIFTDIWNYIYVLLCHIWDKDVDEDLIVKD